MIVHPWAVRYVHWQVEELEQQLKDSSSHETIENLEEKLDVVKDDLERVTEELESHKKQNKTLSDTVAKLEKERKSNRIGQQLKVFVRHLLALYSVGNAGSVIVKYSMCYEHIFSY